MNSTCGESSDDDSVQLLLTTTNLPPPGQPSPQPPIHEEQDNATDWDIILLVDTCELSNARFMSQEDFVKKLRNEGVPCELRRLPVGDYLWIARRRRKVRGTVIPQAAPPLSQSGTTTRTSRKSSPQNHDIDVVKEEIVLDYIIERKTRNNIIYSMSVRKNMTYPQLTQLEYQHYKMKFSQIRNRVLLVEGGSDYNNPNIFKNSRKNFANNSYSIMTNCLQNLKKNEDNEDDSNGSFTIRYTSNIQRTIKYLTELHHKIVQESKTTTTTKLNTIRFASSVSVNVNSTNTGVLTFGQIKHNIKYGFQRNLTFQWYLLLKQVPRVSDDKIKVIQSIYPTKQDYYVKAVLDKDNNNNPIHVISKLRLPGTKPRFGPKIARAIHDLVMSSSETKQQQQRGQNGVRDNNNKNARQQEQASSSHEPKRKRSTSPSNDVDNENSHGHEIIDLATSSEEAEDDDDDDKKPPAKKRRDMVMKHSSNSNEKSSSSSSLSSSMGTSVVTPSPSTASKNKLPPIAGSSCSDFNYRCNATKKRPCSRTLFHSSEKDNTMALSRNIEKKVPQQKEVATRKRQGNKNVIVVDHSLSSSSSSSDEEELKELYSKTTRLKPATTTTTSLRRRLFRSSSPRTKINSELKTNRAGAKCDSISTSDSSDDELEEILSKTTRPKLGYSK